MAKHKAHDDDSQLPIDEAPSASPEAAPEQPKSETKKSVLERLAEFESLSDELQTEMDVLLSEKKAVQAAADKHKQSIDDQLTKMNEAYRRLTGRYYDAAQPPEAEPTRAPKSKTKITKSTKVEKAPKAKRGGRLPSEAKQTEAGEIYNFIKGQKSGTNMAALKAKFPEAKINGPLKPYLKKYGYSITSTGPKTSMVYHASK